MGRQPNRAPLNPQFVEWGCVATVVKETNGYSVRKELALRLHSLQNLSWSLE
jgi:hypothetical protein